MRTLNSTWNNLQQRSGQIIKEASVYFRVLKDKGDFADYNTIKLENNSRRHSANHTSTWKLSNLSSTTNTTRKTWSRKFKNVLK